jgi:hypothetical protein
MSKTWYAKSKPKLRELVKATLFIDQIIATSKNRCTRLVEGFRTHRVAGELVAVKWITVDFLCS